VLLALTSPSFPLLQEYVAYSHTGRIIPAIWFRYDLSPITVKYTERRQPLYRFITTVSSQGHMASHHAPPFLWWPLPVQNRIESAEPQLNIEGFDLKDVKKCHQKHISVHGISPRQYFPGDYH
jgi:hypothetical protein